MIYKLLNFLFGWDYIHWKNTADEGNSRIRKNKDGKVWYYQYWIICVVVVVEKKDDVLWLTCKSSKYIN